MWSQDLEAQEDGWELLTSHLVKCASEEDKTEDAERFWFSAAIWLACQRAGPPPGDDKATPRGNGVSISQIIRVTKIKPHDFFAHTKHFMFGNEELKVNRPIPMPSVLWWLWVPLAPLTLTLLTLTLSLTLTLTLTHSLALG